MLKKITNLLNYFLSIDTSTFSHALKIILLTLLNLDKKTEFKLVFSLESKKACTC